MERAAAPDAASHLIWDVSEPGVITRDTIMKLSGLKLLVPTHAECACRAENRGFSKCGLFDVALDVRPSCKKTFESRVETHFLSRARGRPTLASCEWLR